jgi:hypothetical protein
MIAGADRTVASVLRIVPVEIDFNTQISTTTKQPNRGGNIK